MGRNKSEANLNVEEFVLKLFGPVANSIPSKYWFLTWGGGFALCYVQKSPIQGRVSAGVNSLLVFP